MDQTTAELQSRIVLLEQIRSAQALKISTLDAENAVLKTLAQKSEQDAQRLDFLGYCCHGFVKGTDVSKWTIEAPHEGIRVIRQAIDAVLPMKVTK